MPTMEEGSLETDQNTDSGELVDIGKNTFKWFIKYILITASGSKNIFDQI